MNSTKEISRDLKRKFLFDDDEGSLNLLLNLYDNEDSISNFYIKYFSLSSLKKIILKNLRNNPGKDLAAKNISELIHSDINRLEVYLFLEGYKLGKKSSNTANEIEKRLLYTIGIENLYSKKEARNAFLFEKSLTDFKIRYSDLLSLEILKEEKYRLTVYNYSKNIIRPKLLKVNRYIDRQLKVSDEMGEVTLEIEGKPISRSEIISLNNKIFEFLIKDGIRIIVDGFWEGVLEEVLRRYR